MLVELRVRDLGLITDLTLTFGEGMTALTGETGAGKTLVVEAIELLLGGRGDPVLVRPGATEAIIEGRFVQGGRGGSGRDVETVASRTVPAAGAGRSRASIDGRMVPLAALADMGGGFVDLHGQHAHQSLLAPAVQRAALDAYAGVDLAPLRAARRRVVAIDAALTSLGGDARSRAREIDLLRFQLRELDAAAVGDPDEDESLRVEEEALADADAARAAAAAACEALTGDSGAGDAVVAALAVIKGRPGLGGYVERLRTLQSEVYDISTELREAGEAMEEDPQRLSALRSRRQLLADLRRKYGETLGEVIAFSRDARNRLIELELHEDRVAQLEAERACATADVLAAARIVAGQRRSAAPRLAAAIENNLRDLALPRAKIEVEVAGEAPGDDVSILFVANAGEPPLPLAKVASGGELARLMLAIRLELSDAPPTLVFDEVDAGIGGAAAVAVGRALAALGAHRQVLVVTHLPQVAAFADHQVAVGKVEIGYRTMTTAAALDPPSRVVELSRMLSGQPDSAAARLHAEELLATAAKERGR